MTRGGSKNKPSEERRCLVNGSGQSRSGLVRFVVDPDNNVVPDINERLGGRGVWVSAERDILIEAVKKKHFARGFKTHVNVPEGLVDLVEKLLFERVVSLLALARKSGQATSGADRVGEWLQSGEAAVLFQASDGSPREKRNVGTKEELDAHFECLTREELGLAFGREFVVHAALSGNGIINRIIDDANRLSGLRVINAPVTNE